MKPEIPSQQKDQSQTHKRPLIRSVRLVRQARGRDQSEGSAVRRSDTHNW